MNYSIYAESTPNPEVMKFVANRMLADKSLEFLDASQAKNIPLANELFKLPFVKSIFISTNFVSINKTENVNWDDIALQLRLYISDYLNSIEIMNHTDNIQSEPIEEIQENSSIQIIVKAKNDEAILELLNELLFELKELNDLKKIESLEKELINNLDESSYSELIKLKSQLNRE